MNLCLFLILIGYIYYDPVHSEAIQLKSDNFDHTIASTEYVMINFYVEWCRYSQLLQPIFDEAADLIHKEYDFDGLIAMVKVNCDEEPEIAKKFRITKYPTVKMVLNGEMVKREYRAQRSTVAIVEHVREQLKDPIKKIEHIDALKSLDNRKRVIIGYFDHHDVPEYRVFRRVAANLKDDCDFHAGFGDIVSHLHPAGQPVISFRPDVELSHDEHEQFSGTLNSIDELKLWAHDKCVPIVREITFDNAEELTEEGIPFMILFHSPNDTKSLKDYKIIIKKELAHERKNVLFLTADGARFAHPLAHLGKTQDDLPLIAIDSFRHMYMFPKFEDMYIEGRLPEFVKDLHSGKLHREFHYEPEPNAKADEKAEDTGEHKTDEQKTDEHKTEEHETDEHKEGEHHDTADEHAEKPISENEIDDHEGPTDPPDSSFKKLAPSKNRYTFLKNEL